MAAPELQPARTLRDIAPKFFQLTDEVLFGDVWEPMTVRSKPKLG